MYCVPGPDYNMKSVSRRYYYGAAVHLQPARVRTYLLVPTRFCLLCPFCNFALSGGYKGHQRSQACASFARPR
jgi:hypothetical protein